MSHRVSMVIRLGHAGYALGPPQQGTLAGNAPIGTYQVCMSVMKKSSIKMPYIPSALSVRTSTTSCLCTDVHLRILLSVFTIDLMYFSMSSFCPLSSCKETERKVKGSRIGLISVSGRLVTQMRRFGNLESTRSSRSTKTSSRSDGRDVFGHSSKASTIR